MQARYTIAQRERTIREMREGRWNTRRTLYRAKRLAGPMMITSYKDSDYLTTTRIAQHPEVSPILRNDPEYQAWVAEYDTLHPTAETPARSVDG